MSKTHKKSRVKLSEPKVDGLEVSAIASRIISDANIAALKREIVLRGRIRTVLSLQDVALLSVFKEGPKVFGNKAKFISWLTAPSRPLGSKTPLQLLASNKGRYVFDELGRIEHGIIA